MRDPNTPSLTTLQSRRAERRRALAVAFAGCSAFLGLYVTQPLLPRFETLFHAGKAAVGLTITATTLGVALAAPFIGAVADRLGRKRVIVGSAALLAAATLLNATATGLPSLIFWRFLQGLFTPGVFAVTVAYVHDEWPEASLGRAVSLYVTGTILGGFGGRMISALVISRWSWHGSFLAVGLLGAAGAALLQAWLPRERHFHARDARESFRAGLRMHLRNPRLVATFAVGFGILFTLVATFSYVTFHLAAAPFRLGPAALGLLFCTYLVAALVTPFSGRFIDRHGYRAALGLATILGVAGLFLTLVPDLAAVVAGLALCCTSVFMCQSASNGYIGVAAQRDKALAVGMYVTCYYVGGSLGAELPGMLWRMGGWTACVGLVIAVQILVFLVAMRGWNEGPAEAEAADEARRMAV